MVDVFDEVAVMADVLVLVMVTDGVTVMVEVLELVMVIVEVIVGVATMRDAGRQGRAMPDKAMAGTMLWPKLGSPVFVTPAPQQVAPPDADRVQVW